MARIIVAEDSPTQLAYMRMLLEANGYEVATAPDGQAALELIARRQPDLVITDMVMPRMSGLELVEAVHRDYPRVPVILVTAHGSEDLAAQALRKGAASYVPKRSLAEDLLPTVEKVLAVTGRERGRELAFECLTRAEAEFQCENNPALIPALLHHLEDALDRLRFCDATELTRVSIALQEALLNAMDHGNLELSSDLRQEDEMVFVKAREARRQQPPFRDRRVRLHFVISPAEVVFRIRDEGPGFNPSVLPDPTDPANLDRVGGRGLLLIRTFMDNVSHNTSGNEIVLTKRRSR